MSNEYSPNFVNSFKRHFNMQTSLCQKLKSFIKFFPRGLLTPTFAEIPRKIPLLSIKRILFLHLKAAFLLLPPKSTLKIVSN